MIDWNKLQPYKTTKSKSFEQLCYQIATKIYQKDGKFTSIDDSGGGDGVEFYLTLPNGDEYGWQAKYYEGSSRLKISGRKRAIESSLKKSIKKHPNLKKWFLCLTTDLTPDEKKWFDTKLSNLIPHDKETTLELWDESYIHGILNDPNFNGLKLAFFNQLELSSDWFKSTFEKSFSLVKNKFDDILYTHNEDFEALHYNPMMCNDKYLKGEMSVLFEGLERSYVEIKNEIGDLKPLRHFEQLNEYEQFLGIFEKLNSCIEDILPRLKERLSNISPNNLEKLSKDNYDEDILNFKSIVKQLSKLSSFSEFAESNSLSLFRKIGKIEGLYEAFCDEIKGYLKASNQPAEFRQAHYLGNGGDGKTNFAVGITKDLIDVQLPAIFIPAVEFTENRPISDQILTILDIKAQYSFADFLDCLNALGRVYNVRVPLVLDGLNEALNSQGNLNPRLAMDLPKIETEFASRDNLVFITTCRLSYKDQLWGITNHNDKRFIEIDGFSNYTDLKKLVAKYFSYYKIQANFSFISLEQFTKPLYLKLYCEAINSERKETKEVTLGFNSLYSILQSFVKLCNDNIYKKIKSNGTLPPIASNKHRATIALSEIAKELWDKRFRSFLFDDFTSLFKEPENLPYKDSLAKALLDEDLLFIRNWQNKEDHVFFTYDRMAGFFIAKYLVESILKFEDFFNSEHISFLVGKDYNVLHPNHEDIVDGLCNLLPMDKGLFVHDIISISNDNQSLEKQQLFKSSIRSTIQLPPEFIPSEQVDYVKLLVSRNPENAILYLGYSREVFFIINHPFNFTFWSLRLSEASMNERDVIWSEYLRKLNTNFVDEIVNEFSTLQRENSLTVEQISKIMLVVEFLKWSFTSTVIILNKKASTALYLFAKRFPREFIQQYYSSAKINDPKVLEWMTIVLYNALASIKKNNKNDYKIDLITLANFIYENVLSPNGAHATNHIIIRNYSYNILKLLLKFFPELSSMFNLEQVRKGFKSLGTIIWEESPDFDKERYRDGNSLLDYHFNKEKMPLVSRDKGNEYNPTDEYLAVQAKLRWRAYQLGYEFDRFGELDIEIAKFTQYPSLERYANKYIDLAFREYCGYLSGLEYIDSDTDLNEFAGFEIRFDPSQNRTINEESLVRFIKQDFIDGEISLEKWCNDSSDPDVSQYLQRKSFLEKNGDWILLHGLVHQNKKEKERQFFFQIETVFVRNEDLSLAKKAFVFKTDLRYGLGGIPASEPIHQSEVPDGESIPYNTFEEWNYSLTNKTIKVKYVKAVLTKNGKRLSEEEADEIWDEVTRRTGFWSSKRIRDSRFKIPRIRFVTNQTEKPETLKGAFKELGIELIEESFYENEERDIYNSIEVFVPVRSLLNQVYLCKNMIDDLKLSSEPDATDLYDETDSLASFNYKYEVNFVDTESFTYLRRDLLNQYLSKNNLTMLQIVWGERDYYPVDGDWINPDINASGRKWARFYKAIEYKNES